MPATTGANFLLYVENSGSPGTYRKLGGQRDTAMQRTVDEVNLTSKDSAGWHEGAPVIRNWGARATIVIDETDAAYGDLETAFTNLTKPNVRITTPAGNNYTGAATVTELSLDGPYNDAFICTVVLKGSGVLTKS